MPGRCWSTRPCRATDRAQTRGGVRDIPLLIDFASPSSLLRERDRASALPIVGNGPPGTFVVFPSGLRVSLPTDQIVFADDTAGHARVGFGGMRFVESCEGRLVFVRVREVLPADQLSPARSYTMRLETQWVSSVVAGGRPVWPSAAAGQREEIDGADRS
jgi:hypothetical protein